MLERIQAQVGEDRHVRMIFCADPATGLRDELIFEVVDPYGSEDALGEVEDFLASRRTRTGDQVQLVI
jgi:hypothetical protein